MEQTLHLLTWPDYINPRSIASFETGFGARVKLEVVPSAVELVERMVIVGQAEASALAPGEAVPDVLCPPDYAVRQLSALGLLAELDYAKLPGFSYIQPRFQRGRPHDPHSRFSLVKDWGTTGFMYRTDLVSESPTSWADFWRLAEKYPGQVTVLDSPGEVIGAALKMRGFSYNAADPQALSTARSDLLRLKAHLLAFETNYKPLLASGQACLALGWNGDAASLQAQGLPVQYVIPSEGSQIWEEDWAIAAASPSLELAHAFLDFMLRPEIAAQEARYTRYATGNREAFRLLDDEMKNDPATYPPDALLQKLEAGMPLDADGQHRRTLLWQEMRG